MAPLILCVPSFRHSPKDSPGRVRVVASFKAPFLWKLQIHHLQTEPLRSLPGGRTLSDLTRAIVIAAEAHRGQVDKAGEVYLLHPLRVMLRMKTEEERIAAVLHDLVEDTDWQLEDLRAEGFSEAVLRAVDHLTRREGEVFHLFAKRAALDPIARAVKRADLEDNLDLSRIPHPTEGDLARMAKYRQALKILEKADKAETSDLPGKDSSR